MLGVGGGAGHASHAVNDFRKLCGIESYAPSDNVSELTARTNDEGWDTSYSAWLRVSRLNAEDALVVFSVGGGSREHNVSVNVVNAIEMARDVGLAQAPSNPRQFQILAVQMAELLRQSTGSPPAEKNGD